MGYIVRMEDLLTVKDTLVKQMDTWILEFQDVEKSLKTLSETKSIEGATADSMRAHIKEVQLPYIKELLQFYELFRAAILDYTTRYMQLEPDANAVINQNLLEQLEVQTKQEKAVIFSGIEADMHSVMQRIAACGLSMPEPDGQPVKDVLNKMFLETKDLNEAIGTLEEDIKKEYINDLSSMVENLKNYTANILSTDEINIGNYQVGKIKDNIDYINLHADYERNKDRMKKIIKTADQEKTFLDAKEFLDKELPQDPKERAFKILEVASPEGITLEAGSMIKKAYQLKEGEIHKALDPLKKVLGEVIEEEKKIDPISTGFKVGAAKEILSMVEGIGMGLNQEIEFYDDPVGTIKKNNQKAEQIKEIFTNGQELNVLKGVGKKVTDSFDKNVIHGDAYSRSEFAGAVALDAGTLFVGGGEAKGAIQGVKEGEEALKASEEAEKALQAAKEASLVTSMGNVAEKTGLSTEEITQLCQKLENVQGKSKAEIREILNKLENGTATIAKTEADGKISYQIKDVNGEILAGEGVSNPELYQERINDIRKIMPNSKLQSRGNMAIADVDVQGLKNEYVAHSQINKVGDKGADLADFSHLKSEDERIFASYVEDKFPRYQDTEAKILEDIATNIKDPNMSGTINLYSELPCCQSCSNVILEFRRKFPNIKLNVYVGK